MKDFLNPSKLKSLISLFTFPAQKLRSSIFGLSLLIPLLTPSVNNAQITNLKFSNEAIIYSETSGGTTFDNSGKALGAVSALTPIGFNFVYQGNSYPAVSQYCASSKLSFWLKTDRSVSVLNSPYIPLSFALQA